MQMDRLRCATALTGRLAAASMAGWRSWPFTTQPSLRAMCAQNLTTACMKLLCLCCGFTSATRVLEPWSKPLAAVVLGKSFT